MKKQDLLIPLAMLALGAGIGFWTRDRQAVPAGTEEIPSVLGAADAPSTERPRDTSARGEPGGPLHPAAPRRDSLDVDGADDARREARVQVHERVAGDDFRGHGTSCAGTVSILPHIAGREPHSSAHRMDPTINT